MQIKVGIRAAQWGVLVNVSLAMVKFIAGVVGNSYALIADAVESSADIFGSLVVWGGLHIAGRDPDEEYPFGYGKAESLAAAVVALMMLGAALGIAVQSVREILTPHMTPAPWTLFVLVAVVVVKLVLSRRVQSVGEQLGSTAVRADAWHHLSDAITSAAAFVGIAIAVWGGPSWAAADDWAALGASAVIAYNGALLLRPALYDLMDRTADEDVIALVRSAAEQVPLVLAIEKLAVRKTGLGFQAVIHVQAAPQMSLFDAHNLGGRVKGAIRAAVPKIEFVLIHMEPFEDANRHQTTHENITPVDATDD
jgi:cation diffusion facilitator family transporter